MTKVLPPLRKACQNRPGERGLGGSGFAGGGEETGEGLSGYAVG